jgi:hypothetical protein
MVELWNTNKSRVTNCQAKDNAERKHVLNTLGMSPGAKLKLSTLD